MAMSTPRSYYLAGPMTGIPHFNFLAFKAYSAKLRESGWEIISPHEQDSEQIQKEAMASPDGVLHGGTIGGETWGDILSRDVKIVADKTMGLFLMPGWEKSRGARLEAFVGLLCKHHFYEIVAHSNAPYEFFVRKRDPKWVKDQIFAA